MTSWIKVLLYQEAYFYIINQGKIANPEVTIAVAHIKKIARFLFHVTFSSTYQLNAVRSFYIFSIMNGKDWYDR
ncbi:hypothetical protein AAHB65_13845 [Bacillus toyonensis]